MPAFLGLGQADLTESGAIDRTCAQRMLDAAPTLAAWADQGAGLADQMRAALTIVYCCHRAATGSAEGPMDGPAEWIDIDSQGQRGGWGCC